ncbi:geranylgeranyl pyrophosphate synthase spyE [Aspergillus clavatus NRRL 1]|uniref:(2E,6E)-farnesyl diphosphate synthase n=1 Tax=Aspergillus clavatus (strain ATCC 1007 / CBS 513.65 / DSM 816 / NCTC 3887 / NRRL 1 / QM 1276 / 107) TaxID=344612 RepID=A1C8K1_ASPCL|nr:geranylgeranyl pyrophosphate synthase (AtmG), putative [Aspergillus clavatus NRRL 1]EAW13638.1 geranylgeranyl pyrophosphate synthase (AtmG), putative [Aspergillus clavatus NRRL 1]
MPLISLLEPVSQDSLQYHQSQWPPNFFIAKDNHSRSTNGTLTTPDSPSSSSKSIFHDEADVQLQRKFTQEKIISAPLDYLSGFPGKDIRGKLISSFNEWLKIPEQKLDIIKRVIGLLHTASLLIDDIQDSSKLRRGFPVAHSIFGIAQTINSANFAYFWAQQELQKLGKSDALAIFTDELLRLHRGQGMDLYWRDSLICPTEEEYLDMVSNKTGGLFRLAIKLMQMESQNERDCVPLVDLLGIIFQIRDDYQNLQSDLYAKNKGFGEDITEGKFSYPIIHSIRSEPGNLQLMSILKQKPEDEDVKRYAIRIIESTGSFDYCRQKLASLTAEAREMLAGFGDLEEVAGLNSILDFLELKE